ncbi:unnamed protein product [Schistosoma margrebowiei]|uniref:Uncharacterized protein n=1 Tax=Schistosoma margrebowiei TaxID=48269 RepID=A0A183MHR1_9TREM|nr:unnamed protein product [Schistosoma margrebowiei]
MLLSVLQKYLALRIQDSSQQQVTSLTGSTQTRKNYYGRQLKRDQIITNFNVSGGPGGIRHHKEWISIETPDKTQEKKNKRTVINNGGTRTEKVKAQAEYIEANNEIRKSVRADKHKHMEDLATTEEKDTREGGIKQLYDTTKKLQGKYSKPETPVKDKEGKQISEIQEQRNRWVEHFEEFVNRPAPLNPPNIKAAHTDLPKSFTPPMIEQVSMTIR